VGCVAWDAAAAFAPGVSAKAGKEDRKDLFGLMKVVSGEEVKLPDDDDTPCEKAVDDGTLILGIYAQRLAAAFRPAKVTRWEMPAVKALMSPRAISQVGNCAAGSGQEA